VHERDNFEIRHEVQKTTLKQRHSVPTMSYRSALPSHIRPSSGLATQTNANLTGSTQTSALQTRINEKKAELESLKQLRDLSAGLAGQMQQLEEKLATLSNGTQAVAEVLSNWNGVLRAVYMASGMYCAKDRNSQDGQELTSYSENPKAEGRRR
jgi:DASH complex subunit DAD2